MKKKEDEVAYRLNPRNLCMAEAMPFQQHHEARIFGRNLDDVLGDELLLDVRSNILPGDEVVVCGYADQKATRLTQYVRLRVVSNTKDGVRFVQDGKVQEVPLMEGEPEPEKMEPRLEVVRGLRCFNVIDKKRDDAVLESFRTKAEAEKWASANDVAA